MIESSIVRLWYIGGANNIVRWLELLAAALFTLQVTGSGLAVAVVTAARTIPLLLFGAFAGLLSEAVNRRVIMLAGMAITAVSSLAIWLLAQAGWVQPWHVGLAAFVSGTVWATDMSARRRMVGEAAQPSMIGRVIAVDSLAGSITRMAGPVLGGAAFECIGLSGSYACTTVVTLITTLVALPVRHSQVTHRLSLARIPRDLADGFASARLHPGIRGVIGITVAMNLFAFVYVAIVAPLGLYVFQMPVVLIGVLAACEPLGALIAGILLARYDPPVSQRDMMIGGSALFMAMLTLVPFAPSWIAACILLVIGGAGTAAFSNVQTTLVLAGTAPAVRSRQLGLLTVCMGTGPLGQLLIGALADRFGPPAAIEIMALAALAMLAAVSRAWIRADGLRAVVLQPAVRE